MNVEGVILDAVISLSLFGAVGVEVPVLGFTQVFVIDCLLPCFHSAVFAEIEVGRGAVADVYRLLSGLHFAFCVKGVLLGVDGEELQAGLSVMGNAVFKVKLVNLGFLADAFSAFNGSPAGGTLSVLIIILITGNRGGVGFDSLGSGGGVFCCGKLKPAGLHLSVYKGIVIAVYFLINRMFDALSAVIEVVPGFNDLRIVCFIF